MTMEDYIMLADIPKIQLESEEEFPGLRKRNQSPSPCRDQRLRTYRCQDEIKIYSTDLSQMRGEEAGREGGTDERNVGTLRSSDNQSGRHLSSKLKERAPLERRRHRHPSHRHTRGVKRQGWMSRLDEHGKETLVCLGDTSLRYYRDSEAEESDDLDGEIDLTSCVNVSDCDIERNYGLQIQPIRHRQRERELPLPKTVVMPTPARFTCKDSGYEPSTSTSTTTAANSIRPTATTKL
ncbi:hypothetical protein INR49_006536 [Caranx melampygus]|nr:hypothetical protein INR49_006536 [Caranx melampygus]